MSHKYVYLFTEGNGKMRELLGGKGANLVEMTNISLPVPQGFTISTEVCAKYYEDGRQINADIQAELMDTLWDYSKSGPKKDKYQSLVKVAGCDVVKNEKTGGILFFACKPVE